MERGFEHRQLTPRLSGSSKRTRNMVESRELTRLAGAIRFPRRYKLSFYTSHNFEPKNLDFVNNQPVSQLGIQRGGNRVFFFLPPSRGFEEIPDFRGQLSFFPGFLRDQSQELLSHALPGDGHSGLGRAQVLLDAALTPAVHGDLVAAAAQAVLHAAVTATVVVAAVRG